MCGKSYTGRKRHAETGQFVSRLGDVKAWMHVVFSAWCVPRTSPGVHGTGLSLLHVKPARYFVHAHTLQVVTAEVTRIPLKTSPFIIGGINTNVLH